MDDDDCNFCPKLTVQQWRQGDEWETSQASVEKFAQSRPDDGFPLISRDTRVTVVIASANKIRSCQTCRQSLIQCFQMTDVWWSDYCKRPNGHFGCETTLREGKVSGINTWTYFQIKQLKEDLSYEWNKLNIFTRWLPSTEQTFVLLFDPKAPIRESVPKALLNPDVSLLGNPYWCYIKFLDTISGLEEISVWAIRNHVRNIEKTVMADPIPRPDWRKFHDIARHAIHVTETLNVAIDTIGSIQHNYIIFLASKTDATSPVDQMIGAQLGFFRGYISSLRHRSISNEKRLQNEIQLAFNTVAQYNAGTSVEITRATLADSSAMKTIAFVTLIFLPPTFISSIFSMSFFQCGENDGWGMSSQFWLYWVFAIPITIATVMVWAYWHRIMPAKSPISGQSSPVEVQMQALKQDGLRDIFRGRLSGGTPRQYV